MFFFRMYQMRVYSTGSAEVVSIRTRHSSSVIIFNGDATTNCTESFSCLQNNKQHQLAKFHRISKVFPNFEHSFASKNHITSPSHTEPVQASFGSLGSWENENENQWTKVPGGDQHADPIPSGKLTVCD